MTKVVKFSDSGESMGLFGELNFSTTLRMDVKQLATSLGECTLRMSAEAAIALFICQEMVEYCRITYGLGTHRDNPHRERGDHCLARDFVSGGHKLYECDIDIAEVGDTIEVWRGDVKDMELVGFFRLCYNQHAHAHTIREAFESSRDAVSVE